MVALLNRRPHSGLSEGQERDEKEAAELLARVQGQGSDCRLEGHKTLAELAQAFDVPACVKMVVASVMKPNASL